MKKLSKLAALTAVLCNGAVYSQDWSNSNATPTPDIYRTGRIGSGTFYKSGDTWAWFYPAHGPQLEAASTFPVGASYGNNSLITSVSSACAGGSMIRNNIWSLRNNSGNSVGWSGVNIHDAISVDISFQQPGTNTLTFWERDPYRDTQSWGTAANTYMQLNQNKLAIGSTINLAARLNVNMNGTGSAIQVYDQASTSTVTKVNFSVANTGATKIGVKAGSGIHSDALLSVYGKVLAESIYVNTSAAVWADYVFEKNYSLMPLNELEAYYKKNKHLPEIPTTQDVSVNGDNLVQTDALLLKKVEELTLYIVDLKKEVEALKSQAKNEPNK